MNVGHEISFNSQFLNLSFVLGWQLLMPFCLVEFPVLFSLNFTLERVLYRYTCVCVCCGVTLPVLEKSSFLTVFGGDDGVWCVCCGWSACCVGVRVVCCNLISCVLEGVLVVPLGCVERCVSCDLLCGLLFVFAGVSCVFGECCSL